MGNTDIFGLGQLLEGYRGYKDIKDQKKKRLPALQQLLVRLLLALQPKERPLWEKDTVMKETLLTTRKARRSPCHTRLMVEQRETSASVAEGGDRGEISCLFCPGRDMLISPLISH